MSLFRYAANLVRVIDGDTIVVDIDLGFRTWTKDQRIRLYGIDCPELNTEAGKNARLATADWMIANGADKAPIYLETIKAAGTDKVDPHARWLGTIWGHEDFTGESLNEYLINSGHAVPYMV